MGIRTDYNYTTPRDSIFLQRFREAVDENGGVTSVAEKTGISRQTITHWYNGRRTPDAVNLKIAVEALNISADWLLGFSEVKVLDTSIKAVCDVTGLSEAAVMYLIKLEGSNVSEAILPTISEILTSDVFPAFIINIAAVKYHIEKLRSEKPEEALQEYKILNGELFSAIDSFQELLNVIYNYRGMSEALFKASMGGKEDGEHEIDGNKGRQEVL